MLLLEISLVSLPFCFTLNVRTTIISTKQKKVFYHSLWATDTLKNILLSLNLSATDLSKNNSDLLVKFYLACF